MGLTGHTSEAEDILAAVLAEGDGAPAIARAALYVGLGRLDDAVPEFQQCIEDRDWHVLLLHADPLFAQASEHPQLRALLKQLDLP